MLEASVQAERLRRTGTEIFGMTNRTSLAKLETEIVSEEDECTKVDRMLEGLIGE